MRKFVALAALLLAATVPFAASAQFFAGARLGYGIPFGDLEKDSPMTDALKSEIPIQIDLGLKLGQALAVGVYGSYAFVQPDGIIKDVCNFPGVDCKLSEFRVGAQANLHAANTENTEFWGGVAVGYSQFAIKVTAGGTDDTLKTTGFEGAIQGGFDFLASPSFRVGPFASLTVGQYTKVDDGTTSADITDKAMHGFFTIGVRGLYGG